MGAQMSHRSDLEPRRDRESSNMPPKERRLYRSGSLSSRVSQQGLEMEPMMDGGAGDNMRTRNPSGKSLSSSKSVRSRITSVAEYHEDLKTELKHGYTRNLVLGVTIIVFGSSLQFGWGIGALNQPAELIQDFLNQTYQERTGEYPDKYFITLMWSLITALFIPGGFLGAFVSAFISDKLGRKKAILLSHIPALLGCAISTSCVAAKSPEMLMVGRLISGFNCGLVTGIAPVFLAEITPFNLRGAVGTCHQLFITVGIFISSVFGLREILGTPKLWPYILLLNAIPAIISLIVLPFLPETPRYLMLIKHDRRGAEKALKFYRQQDDVSADMEEMETESSEKEETSDDNIIEDETFSMKQLFMTKQLRIPLLIAMMLQVVQQLSGINAIFFYSRGIFETAGVVKMNIQYAVMGTNLVNVIMTVIAVPIMDRAGRRALILYPMIVMDVILIIITTALNLQSKLPWMNYVSVICVIGYVICFAVGLGPIPMMIAAEMFRQGPRPKAQSLASVVNWTATLIIALCFELIQKAIKEYTFLLFLGLMILFTIFVYFKVPETKNKTFEEIADQFMPGGKIEVEEVMDEDEQVFPNATEDKASKEKDHLIGDHVTANNVHDVASPEEVKVLPKDEEKQQLTPKHV